MPKTLVLFSDGTGNSASKLFKTNVWRLYRAVDVGAPADPALPRQFAFYDNGVGTSAFKPLALLGGALGLGLSRNVRDLYIFLCRMHEPGDAILAFGFSRGAFTIRVLVGLVMTQGLLRWQGNEAELRRHANDAYRAYRAERFPGSPFVGLMRALRNVALAGLNAVLRRKPYAQALRSGKPGDADAVQVDFVGLWDTVDAYGLPVDELTNAIDRFIWPLTMRNYTLSPRVRRACHALALDDERNAFHPRLWNDAADSLDPLHPRLGADGRPLAANVRHERISQVWFAGVHANVGGGYPDDSLAHVPLCWIMAEAQARGLRLQQPVVEQYQHLADENGPITDSRHGLGGYYRYNPRRIEALVQRDQLAIGPVKVHESALLRICEGHDGYAPITLPPGFVVVTATGSIVPADAWLRALPVRAAAAHSRPAGPVPEPDPEPTAGPWVGAGSAYGALREHVYNGVWWRRLAYFATLAPTLGLALMPLLLPGNGACSGALCFLVAPIALVGGLLPSFASAWTNAFVSHPDVAVPLAVAVGLGLWAGGWLDRALHDQMRRLWYRLPGLRPAAAVAVPPPATPGRLGRAVQWLRTRAAYRGALHLLGHAVLPGAFLLVCAYGAVALLGQLGFSALSSWGAVCPDEGPAAAGSALHQPMPLDPRRLCVATGVDAQAGDSYRISLRVPAGSRWWDDGLPAGPGGLECRLAPGMALVMAAGTPLRRHLSLPWFQPMARIGSTGNDSQALIASPHTALPNDRCPVDAAVARAAAALAPPRAGCPAQPPPPADGDTLLNATLVARTSGPLFVYVNDGIPMPWLGRFFYDNNRGCGWLSVRRQSPAAAP